MSSNDDTKPEWWYPQPATIRVKFGDSSQDLPYEQAFAVGAALLESGRPDQAAALFAHLEQFTDRGPRAFIMQAFCEAAQSKFGDCEDALLRAFGEDESEIASALHSAFIAYHVGVRSEGIQEIAKLVNTFRHLPTICLLLGDMLWKADKASLAERCWRLAIQRDRPGGSIAKLAEARLQSGGAGHPDSH